MHGREEVVQFLTKKWEKENGYRLRKELFSWTENKIAVQVRLRFRRDKLKALIVVTQFWYEWFDTKADGTKQWYRTYGLEVGLSDSNLRQCRRLTKIRHIS